MVRQLLINLLFNTPYYYVAVIFRNFAPIIYVH